MNEETFDVDSLNFPEDTTETTGNDTVTPEPKVASEPVVETPQAPIEKPAEPVTEPVAPEIKISDPPAKYDGESDIQYNLRKQIYDAGQAKAQATTPEEKSELANHIKGLRKELAINHKSSESVQTPKIETNESQAVTEEQSEEELAKEALRKMDFLTKDELLAEVAKLMATKQTQDEHIQATREFYSSHKDIAANPAQRDVLEKFVVEKFNITPQSSKQDLLVAMDMARSYLFPKNDTRSARANESASKRDILNVSSNTQTVPTVSKVDEKLQSALKDAGMTAQDMGWD